MDPLGGFSVAHVACLACAACALELVLVIHSSIGSLVLPQESRNSFFIDSRNFARLQPFNTPHHGRRRTWCLLTIGSVSGRFVLGSRIVTLNRADLQRNIGCITVYPC